MQTNRTVPNYQVNIRIRNNEKGTRILKDVEISGVRNVIKKEAEKILKYNDLTTEIQCVWIVDAKVILVMTRVTGKI